MAAPAHSDAPPAGPPGGGPPSAVGGRAASEAADPRTKFISDPPAGGTRPRLATSDLPYTYKKWVCGSYDPPAQLVPPWQQPISSVPSGPPALLTTGGVNSGPILYFEISCNRLSLQLGREVDHVIHGKAVAPIRRRFCRNRLGGRIPFAWHVALWNRLLFDWPDGLPRTRLNT